MKKLFFLIPLLFLSYFFYLQESNRKVNSKSVEIKNFEHSENSSNKKVNSDYILNADFNPEKKLLQVNEKIIWRNFSKYPASELQFHLYPNAFSNNKTEMTKNFYSLDEDEKTHVCINELKVNGNKKKFEYINTEIQNPFDSTTAKIDLDNELNTGDSVIININYELKIPKTIERFGYASGSDFYFIAQWFPKLGVFENGEWICSQYHRLTEFYADFSNYKVTINLPQKYKVGSTGELIDSSSTNNYKTLNYVADNVIDFAWFASSEIRSEKGEYTSKTGRKIKLNCFAQPENEYRIKRYFRAVKNTLKFMENNIDEFPYPNLTFVDVPRSSNIGGMEYPMLFSFQTKLFSPVSIHSPENTIIHEAVHQYFYASVADNEVYEAWLDEGITSYFESKIAFEFYGKPDLYFDFVDYLPIFGLNFLSYNEIPIIYTLGAFPVKQGAYDLPAYYENHNIGSIADTSYKLPTELSYFVNSYAKPRLAFLSLENYIGKRKMLDVFKRYYLQNKFRHVTSKDFLKVLRESIGNNYKWFTDNVINSSESYDYKVTSINKTDKNNYEILVERLEGGIANTQLEVYTTKDTIKINWDGKDRWKLFKVNAVNPVLAAEIDPGNKILLDENFANNSYIVETKYWASLSMAIRWFFWLQNALMIFGSVG